ncbi:MAG TPA: hypothetical protein O0X70_07245 [Methanocorpusculum sp.]|nr:hypothetical protein [Methanocorpusculum sp.]
MAEPIEIGLELTGQDAIDFIEYMKIRLILKRQKNLCARLCWN